MAIHILYIYLRISFEMLTKIEKMPCDYFTMNLTRYYRYGRKYLNYHSMYLIWPYL